MILVSRLWRLRGSYSGSTGVSKTSDVGSIPTPRADKRITQLIA